MNERLGRLHQMMEQISAMAAVDFSTKANYRAGKILRNTLVDLGMNRPLADEVWAMIPISVSASFFGTTPEEETDAKAVLYEMSKLIMKIYQQFEKDTMDPRPLLLNEVKLLSLTF